MEVLLENVRLYLLALKDKSKITTKEWSNISGVPIETVKNILSGKTGKNAGFITVVKLIVSLGGDINEAVGYEKKKEVEVNSIVSLKEAHDQRIAELTKYYETRIVDIKTFCDQRVADVLLCCDRRVEDLRRSYDERLSEQRQLLSKE